MKTHESLDATRRETKGSHTHKCQPAEVGPTDFLGDWTAYIVEPFDVENPVHDLLGFDVNDKIVIEKISDDPLQVSIGVQHVPSDGEPTDTCTLWTPDYVGNFPEFKTLVDLPELPDRAAADHGQDDHGPGHAPPGSRPYVLTVQHIGEVSKSQLERARTLALQCGRDIKAELAARQTRMGNCHMSDEGTDALIKKIEARRDARLKAVRTLENRMREYRLGEIEAPPRELLLTWTNRFKHPGGYAHVHKN